MTSWVVADPGIYLSVALKEPHADRAAALIDQWTQADVRIAAPYLFHYELVSVVRKHIARGTLTRDDGRAALDQLLRLPVEISTEASLLPRAFDLANEHNLPAAYDAVYLALAEQLHCEFWTADLKLFNAVGSSLQWVKWIGNFTP